MMEKYPRNDTWILSVDGDEFRVQRLRLPFRVFREDFERVNGFDMRFRGWDGEDVDIADRIRMAGLRCGWPGPDASVLHLWHEQRKRPANPPQLGLRELARELATVR